MTTSTTDSTAAERQSTAALIEGIATAARRAALTLATLPTDRKNAFLESLAIAIEARGEMLIAENRNDLEAGAAAGLSNALLDRLAITPERISGMAQGLREVAALPDPVGEIIEKNERPNGLRIEKVRVPIGVIGIIYESRPNVTVDCAALCFKSGNASILRGGKESFHSNRALAALITDTLQKHDLDTAAVQLVPTTDRSALNTLLSLDEHIDCIIPRGGEGLIRFVAENSRIPVIKHYKGVCCVYVDDEADAALAEKIVVNAKVQRPSVCNAAENWFVHADRAHDLLPAIGRALTDQGVELRADKRAEAFLRKANVPVKPATEEDYHEEYLDLILAVKVVDSIDDAVDAVNRYGSKHSDAIVTCNEANARKFMAEVDSATVYWNASTRFTDGYEFGLGAEIGISTDKIHARGPMGLRELTTYKFQIYGSGQIK